MGEETRHGRGALPESGSVGEIVCRQSYERRTKWCLFLMDRAVVVLRVQTHLQTAIRGSGSGCSDKRSQLEYVLSLRFLIPPLLD